MLERVSKWRPQTTLANLLLLTAATAVALAYYQMHSKLLQARASVLTMRSLSRQLIVDDPAKIAAVTRLPTIPNEYVLDIHVPAVESESGSLKLRLALEDIVEHGTPTHLFPSPIATISMSPGHHTVEIRHEEAKSSDPESQHKVSVLLDDKVVMHETRPLSWMPANGWTSTGTLSETRTFDAGEPGEIHRRRFNEPIGGGSSRSVPFDKPANGILLWIQ